MSQGRFTKEEAEETKTAVDEIMKAIPKKKLLEFIGHFNDIFLFLEAAKKVAPSEKQIIIFPPGQAVVNVKASCDEFLLPGEE